MTPMQQMIVAVLSSAAVTSAVVKLVEYLVDLFSKSKRLEKEEIRKTLASLKNGFSALQEDNLVLMHDRIFSLAEHLAHRKYITVEEKANLDYLYERYKARGGNHHADEYYKLISELPVLAGGKD